MKTKLYYLNAGIVRFVSAGAFAATATAASAELVPVSPAEGEIVELLTPAQKKIMSIATYDERLAALKKDKESGGKEFQNDKEQKWHTARPIVFKWRATEGEKGPWRITISTEGGAKDGATDVWLARATTSAATTSSTITKEKSATDKDGSVVYEWTMRRPNLALGRKYTWKVVGNLTCGKLFHRSSCSGKCEKCGKTLKFCAMPEASFTTAAQPPRWIAVRGEIKNIRDLGGWATVDGRRVKQGMLFRGQGLNENSPTGDCPGRSRLMADDLDFFNTDLGVKTELDLRTWCETACTGRSPLGDGVVYVQNPSPAYREAFLKPDRPDGLDSMGMKSMAENFRLLCDEKKFPIYFHCIGGADRTGTLAYMLLGVLGVSKHDMEMDYEATFYPTLPEMRKDYSGPDYWCGEHHFDDGLAKYGGEGATWNERVRLYLIDCGVTQDEIEKFRSIMLEKED